MTASDVRYPVESHARPGALITPPKHVIGMLLLTALAVGRVAATYPTFNSTSDEPLHISAGMEWLERGTYTYEYQHPPLARIAVALGPYLSGVRSTVARNRNMGGVQYLVEDGERLLYDRGQYWTTLTLARLGVLPFLVAACVVTFLWARRWFGDTASLWALLLLVCTPPLLGHAGLATTDVACAASTLAALYQFIRWLEAPEWRRSIWLAIAVAVALLTKFSSVAFLGACFPAGLLYALLVARQKPALALRLRQTAVTAGIVFLTMWACYRFTVKPLRAEYGPSPQVDQFLRNKPILQKAWNIALDTPLPLTEVMLGVRDVNRHNAIGHDSYLLGEWRYTGWWYFFPVVLAVKTPLGLLLLAVLGFIAILARFRSVPWQYTLTALFAIVILGVCMASHIDLGVRHILSIYPLLAILGGAVVSQAPEWANTERMRMLAVLPAVLAVWVAADSVRAHPDYLAYFNEFVGAHPEKILAESDVDWGQDLHRLSERLKVLGIQQVSIAYFGSARLDQAGLPPFTGVPPDQPVRGYVAISVQRSTIDYKKNGSYAWLKRYKPLERVGKSIDLFWIE
jgi:hypothetical protein